MFNWRAWILPGAFTVIILTALGVVVRDGPIEADLTERSAEAFASDGTPWAASEFNGRDATLMGVAPTEAAFDAAIASADRVWGVYTVDASGLELLPLADPYELGFAKDAGVVTVTGSFPDETTRMAVLDTIRADLGSETLVDETSLARGAPLDYSSLAAFAAAGLSNLASGTASLNGGSLTVEGIAASTEGLDAEQSRLASLPSGLSLASVSIDPPLADPFTWGAGASADGVSLTGFVPSEEARALIIEAAGGAAMVDDQMEIASGAPDGFVAAAEALLGQFPSLESPAATLSGTEATLSGDAVDAAGFDAVNAFLGQVPPGYDSLSGQIRPPLAAPFSTSLDKDGDSFVLSGALPSETSRALITDAFDMAGFDYTDETTIARGAPEGLDIAQTFVDGASLLAQLSSGALSLTDGALSLTGQAVSFTASEELTAAAQSLGGGAVELTSDIVAGPASPFVFRADATAGSVTLAGFIPSEAQRDTVLVDVEALFPQALVRDELQIADGAPDGFGAIVSAGLRGIGRLENGAFELSDTAVTVSGGALHGRSVAQIEADLASAAPGQFSIGAQIDALPPPSAVDDTECQLLFARLLADNTIRFDTGTAAIDPLSFGLLDRIVRTLQSCPEARVEVGGHTDSDGGDDLNQRLSEARANAVRDYVLAADVREDRVDAIGYGETDPIADNATEEGRARNRRIEITVIRETQP
ncbi:MAG: OmpA family protein [Pseudomonadota bacterium]